MYPPRRPFKRFIKYWIYRFKHGFFPCDAWNLDHEFALWILPRLKYFKDHHCGYPGRFCFDAEGNDIRGEGDPGYEKFNKIIDEMIEGFEFKLQEWDIETFMDQARQEKINTAFELFGEYAQDLWD